jgi:hypothetical protein
MNMARKVEFHARYLWPLLRRFAGGARRCRKCILSERHGPLRDGLCEECRGQVGPRAPGNIEASADARSRFDQLIRSHLRREGRYDALLLLSGGKDSAYILHRMRREYPALRILGVTVNNGLMSPVAIPNAELAARKLEADLLITNAHVGEFARVLRNAFLSLNGRGTYGVVDHADGSMVFQIGQRMAQELGIPLLIGGLSWVQVQRIVGKDDFQLREGAGPLMVFPLAVWRTDEQEIRRTVRKLELMLPGGDSPVVSNSLLILSMFIVDIMNLGYCSFEPEFAQLVREGKTDRNTWLHIFEFLEFATRRGLLDRELRLGLGRLGLTVGDVLWSRVGDAAGGAVSGRA